MQDFTSPNAKPFEFAEGTHCVLLIHGFTGSPGHMRKIGNTLHENGFAVRGILLPGHGTAPQDMKSVSWQDWLNCARQNAQELKAKYTHFSVAGLSMGGDLALILAQEMALTSCITLSAPMKPLNRLAPLAGPFSFIIPTIHSREDPARAVLDKDFDFGYQSNPTSSVVDLQHLIRMAREGLGKITCPVFSAQSHQDKAIIPQSMDIIQSGISSTVKEKLWLENSPHVITISPELPAIMEKMLPFLRAAEKAQ